MTTSYALASAAWKRFATRVDYLTRPMAAERVCDVGAGAEPVLALDAIRDRELEYTVVDISSEELAKAPGEYTKVQADLTATSTGLKGSYDLVISRCVAEHIRHPALFHRNVIELLAPGGRAFHFFSTLYAPPFLVNRLLSERLSHWLVSHLQPTRPSTQKWPAFYRWCRGPTARQVARFQALGYEIEAYDGFFGTARYFERIPPLRRLDEHLAGWLVAHPQPYLTSFAQVLLRKPLVSRSRVRENSAV